MSHNKAGQPDLVEKLLQELVAIPSDFPNEKKISEYASKYLKHLGFKVKKVNSGSGRNNIVATYGVANKYLGFYGHMDTVAPDKHYKRDPYQIYRAGNKLRGLGVADMKGGISAILSLASYAKSNQLPIKVILGVDEENISIGANDLVDSGLLNDIDFLISAESGQVKNVQQAYSVCYGRRGRIAIEIKVQGKKAHAAESHKAVNAIEHAALLVSNLNKISLPNNPQFGATNLVVHEINGRTDSFSVPDECSLTLSALTVPPVKHSDVLKKLKDLAKDLQINASIEPLSRTTPYSESYSIDRSNKFLKLLESQVFKLDSIKPIFSESVADENVFANRLNIPVLGIGPIGGGDHTADEWVNLTSIKNVVRCYEQILKLHSNYLTSES